MHIELIAALLVIVGLVVVPLILRDLADRRESRALAVRAAVHRAAVRALDGESFLTVQVESPGWFRRGSVVLAAPADWEWLIESAWPAIIKHVPHRWDLVLRLDPPARVEGPVKRAA